MKRFVLSAVLLIVPISVAAQDLRQSDLRQSDLRQDLQQGSQAEVPAEDEAELRKLLDVLEHHTEIATRTKLNADFVPGMVSVLYGDEIEARGITNVAEALNLVPGIQVRINQFGNRQVQIRSVGRRFADGNIKFLFDGMYIGSELFAGAEPVLEIPISLVERIEVIRGPGSAIHGEFAYTGVVNVIPRREGRRAVLEAGRFDRRGGGIVLSGGAAESEEKALRWNLLLFTAETEGADVLTGPDLVSLMGRPDLSNAPGEASEGRRSRGGLFALVRGGFSLRSTWLESLRGEFFGLTGALPSPNEELVNRDQHGMVELRQQASLGNGVRAEFHFAGSFYEFSSEDRMLLPPFVQGPAFPEGTLVGAFEEETRLRGGVELYLNRWRRHEVLLAFEVGEVEMGDTYQRANFVPLTGRPLPEVRTFTGENDWLVPGRKRSRWSLAAQDEIKIGSDITLTAGLRFDRYDDVGEELTPRLAAVWRLRPRHILKVQFARAFRPPDFSQMYSTNVVSRGNPENRPMTNDSAEVGYIYRRSNLVARATWFNSELEGVIAPVGNVQVNTAGARLQGAELELESEIGRSWRFDANLSFTDARDLETDEHLPLAADWLANFGILCQPRDTFSLSLRARYVSERRREIGDPRAKLASDLVTHLTASLHEVHGSGLTLRAGIDNLFNEDVRAPAVWPSYLEDLPRPGRTWWARAVYSF